VNLHRRRLRHPARGNQAMSTIRDDDEHPHLGPADPKS
jgi:hypothetical protein